MNEWLVARLDGLRNEGFAAALWHRVSSGGHPGLGDIGGSPRDAAALELGAASAEHEDLQQRRERVDVHEGAGGAAALVLRRVLLVPLDQGVEILVEEALEQVSLLVALLVMQGKDLLQPLRHMGVPGRLRVVHLHDADARYGRRAGGAKVVRLKHQTDAFRHGDAVTVLERQDLRVVHQRVEAFHPGRVYGAIEENPALRLDAAAVVHTHIGQRLAPTLVIVGVSCPDLLCTLAVAVQESREDALRGVPEGRTTEQVAQRAGLGVDHMDLDTTEDDGADLHGRFSLVFLCSGGCAALQRTLPLQNLVQLRVGHALGRRGASVALAARDHAGSRARGPSRRVVRADQAWRPAVEASSAGAEIAVRVRGRELRARRFGPVVVGQAAADVGMNLDAKMVPHLRRRRFRDFGHGSREELPDQRLPHQRIAENDVAVALLLTVPQLEHLLHGIHVVAAFDVHLHAGLLHRGSHAVPRPALFRRGCEGVDLDTRRQDTIKDQREHRVVVIYFGRSAILRRPFVGGVTTTVLLLTGLLLGLINAVGAVHDVGFGGLRPQRTIQDAFHAAQAEAVVRLLAQLRLQKAIKQREALGKHAGVLEASDLQHHFHNSGDVRLHHRAGAHEGLEVVGQLVAAHARPVVQSHRRPVGILDHKRGEDGVDVRRDHAEDTRRHAIHLVEADPRAGGGAAVQDPRHRCVLEAVTAVEDGDELAEALREILYRLRLARAGRTQGSASAPHVQSGGHGQHATLRHGGGDEATSVAHVLVAEAHVDHALADLDAALHDVATGGRLVSGSVAVACAAICRSPADAACSQRLPGVGNYVSAHTTAVSLERPVCRLVCDEVVPQAHLPRKGLLVRDALRDEVLHDITSIDLDGQQVRKLLASNGSTELVEDEA
eukprot:scaffold47_cov258-Pinguiococcus_pyrenoidosus.AAC.14